MVQLTDARPVPTPPIDDRLSATTGSSVLNVPNQLTIARLVLSVVLFVLLAFD